MTKPTRRKLIRIAIVTVLCAPVVVLSTVARGLGVADFSGWDMGGKATAVQFVFNMPSLGVPARPTGELNFAFSESMLQSGPAAYGIGSSVWPGQVVAALPSFLQHEIETQAGQEFFPVDVPNYPIRAESFYPQGPTSASLDAGTIHMRSNAKETTSEGISYLNSFEIPFIAAMGNQSSFAQSGFDPQGAVSTVEAAATDLSFVNGLITIDSVVTRATARSDGEKGSVAGGTTIAGARVEGVGDVIIDTEGIRVADGGVGVAAAQQVLNQILNQAGISIELSKPVDTIAGPKASRSLGGLLISVRSDTLDPLIAALPDDLETEIRGQLTLDQTVSIQVAPAVVTAAAVKNVEFDIPDAPPVVDDTSGGAGDGVVGPVDSGPAGNGGDTGGTIAAPPSDGGTPATVRTTFEGVPLWLVVVLMLLSFLASRPLTAVADRLLAARAGSACPNEDL